MKKDANDFNAQNKVRDKIMNDIDSGTVGDWQSWHEARKSVDNILNKTHDYLLPPVIPFKFLNYNEVNFLKIKNGNENKYVEKLNFIKKFLHQKWFASIHTPIEKQASRFYASSINVNDNLINSKMFDILNKGYVVKYDDYIVNNAYPIFEKNKNENELVEIIIARDDNTFDVYDFIAKQRLQILIDKNDFQINYFEQAIGVDNWTVISSTDDLNPFYFDVITQIQAYDLSVANMLAYLNDLANAQLVIRGYVDEQLSDTDLEKLGKSSVMMVQARSTGGQIIMPIVEYINKQYDSAGDEAIKNRTKHDIMDFLGLPDLNDLSGNVSADTLRIKLINTNMMAKYLADNVVKNLEDKNYTIDFGIESQTELPSEQLTNIFNRLGNANG